MQCCVTGHDGIEEPSDERNSHEEWAAFCECGKHKGYLCMDEVECLSVVDAPFEYVGIVVAQGFEGFQYGSLDSGDDVVELSCDGQVSG